jgi:fatty acid amide hydrolase
MRASRPCGTEELWQRAGRLHRWQSSCFDAMRRARLDALLCAPFGLPAFEHGSCAELLFAGSYAFLPGALGCPSGVVPVTRVRPGEESDRPASSDRWLRAAERAEQGSAGLPVGVQVVGRPWRDEQVVAIMAAIEQTARAHADFPLTPIDPASARPSPS